jgi:hypothetical protein
LTIVLVLPPFDNIDCCLEPQMIDIGLHNMANAPVLPPPPALAPVPGVRRLIGAGRVYWETCRLTSQGCMVPSVEVCTALAKSRLASAIYLHGSECRSEFKTTQILDLTHQTSGIHINDVSPLGLIWTPPCSCDERNLLLFNGAIAAGFRTLGRPLRCSNCIASLSIQRRKRRL